MSQKSKSCRRLIFLSQWLMICMDGLNTANNQIFNLVQHKTHSHLIINGTADMNSWLWRQSTEKKWHMDLFEAHFLYICWRTVDWPSFTLRFVKVELLIYIPCSRSASLNWAFFFFVTFLAGRKTAVSQTMSSTLLVSRLVFPCRLLSWCQTVKHHRSARLPLDEQAAQHTPLLQSRSLLLFYFTAWRETNTSPNYNRLQTCGRSIWDFDAASAALHQHKSKRHLMPASCSASLDAADCWML